MEQDTLRKLELLNQLSLNEVQKANLLAFFADREKELDVLNAMNTDDVERMVHVMPMTNVLRDDAREQKFTRESLLSGAPERSDDSWQVPRLVK